MLKKCFILLIVLASVTGSVGAQARIGIKFGYNLGGVIGDFTGRPADNKPTVAGNPDNFQIRSGFQGGLIVDWKINDVIALQPGARFAMQGFKDEYRTGVSATSGNKETRIISMYYLQVPLNVQYRLNIAEETNLLFQAGPYAGFGLFGRQTRIRNGKTLELSDNHKKITFGNDKGFDVQKLMDYGVGAGVGIEFIRFQFMLGYDFGLAKMPFQKAVGSGNYHFDMRNHNFSATIGIIFGRRDPLYNR